MPSKVDVTLTLDRDLVDHFYACGKDWRKELNATLRKAVFDQTVDS